MSTIINADTSTGGAIITGDGSGTLELQSAGVTKLTVNGSGVTLATPLPVASGGTGSTSAAFVNLASNVTGTLPIANGGTGTTSTTFTNLTTNVTGTLPIANGGTNSTSTPTAGGAIYGTGTAFAVTAAGTSGQVLTSAGSGAPSWQSPASGSLVLLVTTTVSNSAYATFDNYFTSTYTHYFMTFNDLLNTSGSVTTLRAQMRTSGAYVITSNYTSNWLKPAGTNNAVESNQASATSIQLGVNTLGIAASSYNAAGYIYIYNPLSTTKQKIVQGIIGQTTAYPWMVSGATSGSEFQTTTVTGIRFYSGSGNISGTFSLYGIAK